MSKIFISHRGNLFGPNPSRENQPAYIQEALDLGYNVEVDVWLLNEKFYFGHDKPEYIVSREFLINSKLWIHCKNLNALNELIFEPEVNCFAHNTDDYVLTSHSYIWCFPNNNTKLTDACIAVLPERTNDKWDLDQCGGICSDYIEQYRTTYEKLVIEHVEIEIS